MPNPKAVIFGCHSTQLLAEEKAFFQRTDPLGFILFARNCETPEQIKHLVLDLRKAVGRTDAPVLIDQEGGRVARLMSPHWRTAPPAETFGLMAEEDPEKASWCVRANAWLIGRELKDLGINVNCAPVVDVLHQMTHPVIGDRAFSHHPDIVATLALQFIKGLKRQMSFPLLNISQAMDKPRRIAMKNYPSFLRLWRILVVRTLKLSGKFASILNGKQTHFPGQ